MDLAILMFVAIIFLIASVILGLIYKFGMKEKSYEEALAEQKLSTHSLYGIKQKPKEKKNKKLSKKAKDIDPDKIKKVPASQEGKGFAKTEKSRTEDSIQKQKDESKNKFAPNQLLLKNGNINSAEALLSPQDTIKDKAVIPKKVNTGSSNKPKANVNKKDQPKADSVKEKHVNVKRELIKKEESSDQLKADSAKDNQSGDSVKLVKKELPSKGQIEEHGILDKKEELLMQEVSKEQERKVQNKPSKSNQLIQNPIEKETVEKVLNNSKPSLANGFVVNASKDKKKKKDSNAFNQLAAQGEPGLTFILNMIHIAELSHADIQYLINLLLNKQLDAPKVLEDWSEGKYDPVQKLKKQLAEKEKALIDEQETLAGVQIKLKEIRTEQLAERTSSNQKIKILEEQLQNLQMDLHACNNRCHTQGQQLQQTQAQLNEERMKLHSLREELAAVQMQRQQLEMHIAQESEVMIAQLRADIQEYSARNEQMLIDINTIQKVAADNEASYIAQLSNMTQELGEKSRQLEELHIELANKNEMLYRQEGELKTEIAQLNTVMQQQAEEMRKTEKNHEENMEEINNLKKQKNISNKVIAQLKSEIEKLQEYRTLQEASIENNKINETEVLNWKNELAYVKNLSEEKENKLKSEVESNLSLISKLESELEEQKTKNNDLRNKNYKIMEALNAAEIRIKTIQEENFNKEKNSSNEKTSDIDAQKKFLSRLLPEVNGLEDISSEKWEDECSKLVTNYLETLKKNASNESTENLQARIEHYQNVIKNTEDMLAKLQVNIDQEQISWKAQIKNKDLELEKLKEKLEKLQNIETINGSSFEGQ